MISFMVSVSQYPCNLGRIIIKWNVMDDSTERELNHFGSFYRVPLSVALLPLDLESQNLKLGFLSI